MDSKRLVSLAAGTMLDVDPARGVDVAAAAGFAAVGLWYDPATWTDATTTAVDRRLRATGLVALDIEPVILGRGADSGERLIAAAATLGVRFLLVASGPATRTEVATRLAALCDHAAAMAPDLVLALEFLPIFTIATLRHALDVVAQVGRTNAGVLVDTLHLFRSGGSVDDIAAAPVGSLPYLQVADAPLQVPVGRDALREEALHERLLPGEGVLPIGAVLRAVPDVPISIELRSRALTERYPDPTDRARVVLDAFTRSVDPVDR